MNIWSTEKKPDKELSKPIIQSPNFKQYLTQQTIEEGLANSVYAYVAWKHHNNRHMFESAVNNLFFTPLTQISKLGTYPLIVEVTTTDLKLFKMHGERFKKCLKEINTVLHDKARVEIPEGGEKFGPADPVFVLEISLLAKTSVTQ